MTINKIFLKSKTLQGQRDWERKQQQNFRSKKADRHTVTGTVDQKS